MSDAEFEKTLEVASLLPERYYMIIRQDGEDSFSMSAYDTTKDEETDEFVPAGSVMLAGLVELLENDFERVMSAGLARMSFQELADEILKDESDEDKRKVERMGENILKVDFGREQ